MSLILAALVFTACSKVHEIPREQIGAAEYQKGGSYRIHVKNHGEYAVRRYSVNDSTVVIQELRESDELGARGKQDMPIVVPLSDIERITVLKTNYWILLPVGIAAGLVVVAIIAMSNNPIHYD